MIIIVLYMKVNILLYYYNGICFLVNVLVIEFILSIWLI